MYFKIHGPSKLKLSCRQIYFVFPLFQHNKYFFSITDLLLAFSWKRNHPSHTFQQNRDVRYKRRHFRSVHWWIGDGSCNYRVLCGVWLQRNKGQREQSSSFLIFPREINIIKRCSRAPVDHKVESPLCGHLGTGEPSKWFSELQRFWDVRKVGEIIEKL